MADLELRVAKPALKDLILNLHSGSLGVRQRVSIAAFAFKCCVVADHMGSGRPPFFTVEERRRFASTLEVPGGVQMWIGALRNGSHGIFNAQYVTPATSAVNDFELYVFSFAVGHLVFQVVGARWEKDYSRGQYPFPPLRQNKLSDRFATPFWPIGNNHITWPPPNYLPHNSIDSFADRWTKLRIGTGSPPDHTPFPSQS